MPEKQPGELCYKIHYDCFGEALAVENPDGTMVDLDSLPTLTGENAIGLDIVQIQCETTVITKKELVACCWRKVLGVYRCVTC